MVQDSKTPRVTFPVLRVLSVLLDHPGAPHYGLDLSRRAELATGTIYPILTRLEQAGWIRSNWEETAPSELGRPRRRLYWLTDEGTEQAARALEEGRQALVPDRTRQRRGLHRPRPWGSPA